MKPLSINEVKQLELEILLSLDKFCRKKNIMYYLADGTLIGAVRHHGFIPWDDDVDVQMPRNDYNFLMENYNIWEDRPKYYRLIAPKDSESRHSIVKIIDTRTIKIEEGIDYRGELGVDIDVFALDGMPSDELEWKRWYKKIIRTYEEHLTIVSKPPSGTKARIKYIFNLIKIAIKYGKIDKNIVLDKALKLHSLYPWKESTYGGKVECAFNSPKNRLQTKWFGEGEELLFEGYKLIAPKDHYQVLTSLYGNFMKLPSKEKQVSHHSSIEYWKNNENEGDVLL